MSRAHRFTSMHDAACDTTKLLNQRAVIANRCLHPVELSLTGPRGGLSFLSRALHPTLRRQLPVFVF